MRSSTPSSLTIPTNTGSASTASTTASDTAAGAVPRPLSSSALQPPSNHHQASNTNRHSFNSLGHASSSSMTSSTSTLTSTNVGTSSSRQHAHDSQSIVSSNPTASVSVASNLATFTMDEVELYQNDQRYRKYCKAIDDVLKKFESTSEWADLVQALGKLNQVFHASALFIL